MKDQCETFDLFAESNLKQNLHEEAKLANKQSANVAGDIRSMDQYKDILNEALLSIKTKYEIEDEIFTDFRKILLQSCSKHKLPQVNGNLSYNASSESLIANNICIIIDLRTNYRHYVDINNDTYDVIIRRLSKGKLNGCLIKYGTQIKTTKLIAGESYWFIVNRNELWGRK